VAARSNAIVSSLFPTAVRDRLMQEQEHDAKTRNLKGFLSDKSHYDSKSKELLFQTKPIADLFPETTVIFADIVNFTAWSSVRDPSQVFTLLEAVYNAFDDIARKRRVFKVETIGDCYVAVCGLPEPAKDHAVNMARFARDCMRKMWALMNSLEASLGPDTGDLTMRMGLHSGPVTAGVLRGERSRFQLFGDTMNTGKDSNIGAVILPLIFDFLTTCAFSNSCTDGIYQFSGPHPDFTRYCRLDNCRRKAALDDFT
jgi:Adenylate and Guanylate cyclase catalytic domain